MAIIYTNATYENYSAAISYSCPTCKAVVGQFCLTTSGGKVGRYHGIYHEARVMQDQNPIDRAGHIIEKVLSE